MLARKIFQDFQQPILIIPVFETLVREISFQQPVQRCTVLRRDCLTPPIATTFPHKFPQFPAFLTTLTSPRNKEGLEVS